MDNAVVLNSSAQQDFSAFTYEMFLPMFEDEYNHYEQDAMEFNLNNEEDGDVEVQIVFGNDGMPYFDYSYNEDFSELDKEEFEEWFARNQISIVDLFNDPDTYYDYEEALD